MCTNRALVNSLECYMDDLVDSFEDYVKKSLILISLGVGTIVLMLVYMLRELADRTPQASANSRAPPITCCRSTASLQSAPSRYSLKKRNSIKSDFMLQCCEPKLTCSSTNTLPMPVPSFDERVLRDKGTPNCNKNCELKKRSGHSNCSSRISIPSLPACLPKKHLSPPRKCVKMLKRTSCCSMCCDDDKSNFS